MNNLIKSLAVALAVISFGGCSVFKQDTLSTPINIADAKADFRYNIHAVTTGADGAEVFNDGDVLEIGDVGKKDSYSASVDRTYFDPYRAKIEGYKAAAQIAAAKAASGPLTDEDILIVGLMFNSAADEDMGQYVQTESVDAQRSSDADAMAQARVAQFSARAEHLTARDKLLFDTANKAIGLANPVGYAIDAGNTLLGDYIASRSAAPAPVVVEPVE